MKKLVAFFTLFSLFMSCLCINSFATENVVYNFVPLNENVVSDYSTKSISIDNDFTVVTKHASGEITSEVKERSSYNRSELINREKLNTEPYLPEISPYQKNENLAKTSSDNYGRTPVFDSRVGLVVGGFDTDDNGEANEWAIGTGSLQNYDIVVSCAHVLWSPLYSDFDCEGWVVELDYLAGVNGDMYNPLLVSSYESISISQAYVDESYVTVDENGDYIAHKPQNHDWSIIQIADNVGGQLGWFGLHRCGVNDAGASIYKIGYPYDKDYTQWKSTGSITSFQNNLMFHNAYITSGDSGCPILNNGLVYGIATGKISGQFSGVRIFDELFEMIVQSRNESEARWG